MARGRRQWQGRVLVWKRREQIQALGALGTVTANVTEVGLNPLAVQPPL